MIKTCTSCIYIIKWQVVFFRTVWQTAEEEKIKYFVADLSGRHAYNCSCHADLSLPGYSSVLCLLYFVTIVCLSCTTHCLDLCSIIFQKFCCSCVPSKEKQCESPGVRCFKLLARPAARPREPDLAAPRLQRVKHCTQRSLLHLYAPYIGRLLLQPTGTWLLAS